MKIDKLYMINIILSSPIFQIGILSLAFFAPIHIFFIITTLLIIFDMITAIMRKWKCVQHRFKTKLTLIQKLRLVRSNKIRKSFLKFMTYNIFIALVYMLDIALTGGFLHLAHIALGFISLSELYSICENMDIINDVSIFTKVFRKIRQPLERWLNVKISDNQK